MKAIVLQYRLKIFQHPDAEKLRQRRVQWARQERKETSPGMQASRTLRLCRIGKSAFNVVMVIIDSNTVTVSIGHLHDDAISLQLPECFEASYCIQYFFFCEESLLRDTSLHYKDCSEMHSGSCSQMASSCKCPIETVTVLLPIIQCRLNPFQH